MTEAQHGNLDLKTMLYWTTLSARQLEQFKREGMQIPEQYEWKGMLQPARWYLDGRVKSSANETRIDTNLEWGDDYLLLALESKDGDFEGSLGEDMDFYNNRPVNLSRVIVEKVGKNVVPQNLEGLSVNPDVRNYFEQGNAKPEYRATA